MPLIIPKDLPAYEELQQENVFVMHQERAMSQHIRPLRILILNLMPTKIVTETQLARLLANSPLQVQVTFLQTATHSTTHTAPEHMKAFYKTFDEIKNERFDGMIITGAPIEDLDYEDVDYWDELCRIMDYTKENVYSTIHLCWGALAGLSFLLMLGIGGGVEQDSIALSAGFLMMAASMCAAALFAWLAGWME